MKPFDQWTPDELVANLDAAIKTASVDEIIVSLAMLSGIGIAQSVESTLDETSRRRLIRLLAGRLAIRTMQPEYLLEAPKE